MRLLMEQANTQQAQQVPNEALMAKSNEVTTPIGSEDRTLETESGGVSWKELKEYLPKSRKAFSLSRSRWACALTKSCRRWCETKVGVLLEIAANPHDRAPCPQVLTKFLDVVRMEQVTRVIAELAARLVGAPPNGTHFTS